jgi:Fur family transcriptional regulator, ferric uptake regulator
LFGERYCNWIATEERSVSPQFERRALLHELISKGIRLTAQRRALIEVIQEAKGHLDAGSLLELGRRREPNINRATVYRTIELLKKLRLIDELDLMHLEGEKHYYEVKTRCDHMHLACFRCGRIEEYSSPLFERLKERISKQTGFAIRVTRLELGGHCRACGGGADTSGEQEDAETETATAINQ